MLCSLPTDSTSWWMMWHLNLPLAFSEFYARLHLVNYYINYHYYTGVYFLLISQLILFFLKVLSLKIYQNKGWTWKKVWCATQKQAQKSNVTWYLEANYNVIFRITIYQFHFLNATSSHKGSRILSFVLKIKYILWRFYLVKDLWPSLTFHSEV